MDISLPLSIVALGIGLVALIHALVIRQKIAHRNECADLKRRIVGLENKVDSLYKIFYIAPDPEKLLFDKKI
jgi:hypothetical protein